jgi:transposase
MSFVRTVTSRGHKYQQLVENRWNPLKKQSETVFVKQIGTVVDTDKGTKVVPARIKIDSVEASQQVGPLALFFKLAEKYQVRECISKAFHDLDNGVSDAVLVLTLNQLLGRKPLTKIRSWLSASPLVLWEKLDPTKFTKDRLETVLDALCYTDDAGRMSRALAIQKNCVQTWRSLCNIRKERSYLYYDITRIRYYGKKCPFAEEGYGKERGKTHVGFGLVTSRSSRFPYMAFPVYGSHPDSTTLEGMIDNLKSYRMRHLMIVLDRGILNTQNLAYARKAGMHVLGGGSKSCATVRELLQRWNDGEIEIRDNLLKLSSERGVYAKDSVEDIYGQTCRIVVVLDNARRARERLERDLLIQELEDCSDPSRISQLKEILGNLVESCRGRRGWKINQEIEKRSQCEDGRFLLLCTDRRVSKDEIVHAYYQRDEIEKAFRILKGTKCLSAIGYRKPGHVEAYLSVINFLAYELIAAMDWTLKTEGLGVSVEELVERISNIHEVELRSGEKIIRRWTHISDEQDTLIKPFGVRALET